LSTKAKEGQVFLCIKILKLTTLLRLMLEIQHDFNIQYKMVYSLQIGNDLLHLHSKECINNVWNMNDKSIMVKRRDTSKERLLGQSD